MILLEKQMIYQRMGASLKFITNPGDSPGKRLPGVIQYTRINKTAPWTDLLDPNPFTLTCSPEPL